MSMSFGASLRTMSRTQPPAKYAIWPCSRSFTAMLRAVPSIVTATSFALCSLVGQPFPVASLGIGKPERLPCNSAGANQSLLPSAVDSGFLAQGMNDEADHRGTDAGIGDVKG